MPGICGPSCPARSKCDCIHCPHGDVEEVNAVARCLRSVVSVPYRLYIDIAGASAEAKSWALCGRRKPLPPSGQDDGIVDDGGRGRQNLDTASLAGYACHGVKKIYGGLASGVLYGSGALLRGARWTCSIVYPAVAPAVTPEPAEPDAYDVLVEREMSFILP